MKSRPKKRCWQSKKYENVEINIRGTYHMNAIFVAAYLKSNQETTKLTNKIICNLDRKQFSPEMISFIINEYPNT